MNWLNLEDLLIIHEQVIEETGGVRGVINGGGVETALYRSFTAFGGEQTIEEIAAWLEAHIETWQEDKTASSSSE